MRVVMKRPMWPAPLQLSGAPAEKGSEMIRDPQETERRRREQKLRRELGPKLVALMQESEVVEVMVNADGAVWVERLGALPMNTGLVVEPARIKAALGTLASLLDTVVTKDRPWVQGELDLFSGRIQGLRSPVVTAPVLCFRKRASRVFHLRDYVASGRMSESDRVLLQEAIRERRNILVVGGTGTGKTTFVNAFLHEVSAQSPNERIVLIEDTRELQCALENRVELRAVPDVASMNTLLRAALRLRPDRIVVGEVRGPEALTLLKAWNTGHPGGIATVHANDAEAALRRLELLMQEACGQRLPELIAQVVDLIVHLERGARVGALLRVDDYVNQRYQTRISENPHVEKMAKELPGGSHGSARPG